VLQQRGEVDPHEWRFLLAGPAVVPAAAPAHGVRAASAVRPGSTAPGGLANPRSTWLTDKSWGEMVALAALPAFAGFDAHLAQHEAHYHAMFDSAQVGGAAAPADAAAAGAGAGRASTAPCCQQPPTLPPRQAHEMPLAEPYASRLSAFQRLLVLRCLRPDKVLAAARGFVGAVLGARFVEPAPFDLATCFRESGPATPLVFVLSPGAPLRWRPPPWNSPHGPPHSSSPA
jgi:dynein heavy chain